MAVFPIGTLPVGAMDSWNFTDNLHGIPSKLSETWCNCPCDSALSAQKKRSPDVRERFIQKSNL